MSQRESRDLGSQIPTTGELITSDQEEWDRIPPDIVSDDAVMLVVMHMIGRRDMSAAKSKSNVILFFIYIFDRNSNKKLHFLIKIYLCILMASTILLNLFMVRLKGVTQTTFQKAHKVTLNLNSVHTC